MMVLSPDGLRLAVDVTGQGPAIILLHGFTNDRRMIWHDHGIVARLAESLRVITLDLRGCGESDAPADPARYGMEAHCNDVLAVADACDAPTFMLWGWSFGATISTHLAARSDRVARAVIAGTYFRRLFTEDRLRGWIAHTELLARAKAEDRLDDLTPDQREFVARTDFDVLLARYRGLGDWPTVEPDAIRCPALVIGGTRDTRITVALAEQQAAIEAAGMQFHLFDGVDHAGLITETTIIWPVVLSFLDV